MRVLLRYECGLRCDFDRTCRIFVALVENSLVLLLNKSTRSRIEHRLRLILLPVTHASFNCDFLQERQKLEKESLPFVLSIESVNDVSNYF